MTQHRHKGRQCLCRAHIIIHCLYFPLSPETLQTLRHTKYTPWYLVSKGASVLYVILACMPCIYTYLLLMWVSLCDLSSPGCSLDVWPSPDMSVSTQVYCDAHSLRPSLISPHINHKSQVRGAIEGLVVRRHCVNINNKAVIDCLLLRTFHAAMTRNHLPWNRVRVSSLGPWGEREPDYRAQSVYLLRFLVTPRGGGAHLYRPR